MTTIAYKDGIVAYDSRTTRGNFILTDNADKKHETNANIFFMTGSMDEFEAFIECYERGIKPLWELDVSAFVWSKEDRKLYVVSCIYQESVGNICFKNNVVNPQAIGSGYQLAVAAIDHGKTAKEAVEYAMTRDPGTGGLVKEFVCK